MMNMGAPTRRTRRSRSNVSVEKGHVNIELGHPLPENQSSQDIQQQQMTSNNITKSLRLSASNISRRWRETISRRQVNNRRIPFDHAHTKKRRLRFGLANNVCQLRVAGIFFFIIMLVGLTVYIYMEVDNFNGEIIVVDKTDKKISQPTMNKLGFQYLTFVDPIESAKEVSSRIMQQRPTAIVFSGGLGVSDSGLIWPLLPLMDQRDHGNLDIELSDEDDKERIIDEDDTERVVHSNVDIDMTDYRDPNKPSDDGYDQYYAFDDDYARNEVVGFDSENSDRHPIVCRRFSEHMLNLRNCNTFHEIPYLESNVNIIGEGSYRQVFSVENIRGYELEKVAIKEYVYENDFGIDGYEFVRMDAIVAERLSSSPRTFDIYGFCSLSIMSEYFHHHDIRQFIINPVRAMQYQNQNSLPQNKDLAPQNKLTSEQKLVLALQMAEALSELHGYKNSLIIHGDVRLPQFLFNEDKSLVKINDFNRAEFPLWSETEQKYCTYKKGWYTSYWRSPEENMDRPLDEKIDIWALGCDLYALLTGLSPVYSVEKDKNKQKEVKEVQTAFIDPRYKTRSIGEKKLAEIIEKCWKFQPHDRPSIFEVVSFLKDGVKEALGDGGSSNDADDYDEIDIRKILQGINTGRI